MQRHHTYPFRVRLLRTSMTLVRGAAPTLPVSNQSAQIQSVWCSLCPASGRGCRPTLFGYLPALTSSVVPQMGLAVHSEQVTVNSWRLDRQNPASKCWSFSERCGRRRPVVGKWHRLLWLCRQKNICVNLVTGGNCLGVQKRRMYH